MNNRGEIAPLSRLARPHVAVVTNIAPAHLGPAGLDGDHRRGEGRHPRGAGARRHRRCCRPTARRPARLRAAPRPRRVRAVLFGEAPAAERAAGGAGAARRDGSPCRGRRRRPWKCGCRCPCRAAHGDERAGGAGGGAALGRRSPASSRQALAGFARAAPGAARAVAIRPGRRRRRCCSTKATTRPPPRCGRPWPCWRRRPGARRIAVLGDMLELGDEGAALHAALAADAAAAADLVFACGPLMAALHAALPAARRGAHARRQRGAGAARRRGAPRAATRCW